MRNAPPVQREVVPVDADAVGQVADVAERIRIVADAPGELLGIHQLRAVVVGAEIAGDQRLVEVGDRGQQELLVADRLPGRAHLDVARQGARLILADEHHARAQVLDVRAETEAHRRDLVERADVEAEGGAHALLRRGGELDVDPLEGGPDREVGKQPGAVGEAGGELVGVELAGGGAVHVHAVAAAVGEEGETAAERSPALDRLDVGGLVVGDVVREPGHQLGARELDHRVLGEPQERGVPPGRPGAVTHQGDAGRTQSVLAGSGLNIERTAGALCRGRPGHGKPGEHGENSHNQSHRWTFLRIKRPPEGVRTTILHRHPGDAPSISSRRGCYRLRTTKRPWAMACSPVLPGPPTCLPFTLTLKR